MRERTEALSRLSAEKVAADNTTTTTVGLLRRKSSVDRNKV